MTEWLVEAGFLERGLGGVWFHPMGPVEGVLVVTGILLALTWVVRRP